MNQGRRQYTKKRERELHMLFTLIKDETDLILSPLRQAYEYRYTPHGETVSRVI